MTRVLGLDLSLTATGYAYNDEVTGVIRSKARGMPRLRHICDEVMALAYATDVAVLEDYAFSRADAHAHALGELGGVVRLALHDERIPYVDVKPSTLKKFATDKGNAPKDAMLAAAIRRFGFEGSDNNEADAWLLRAMGLAYYDGGVTAGYMTEALTKVEWPKLDIVERVS